MKQTFYYANNWTNWEAKHRIIIYMADILHIIIRFIYYILLRIGHSISYNLSWIFGAVNCLYIIIRIEFYWKLQHVKYFPNRQFSMHFEQFRVHECCWCVAVCALFNVVYENYGNAGIWIVILTLNISSILLQYVPHSLKL